MGSLRHFDIKKLKDEYGLKTFVETGTWKGDAVEFAYQCGYSPIYSIELKEEFWVNAVNRFKSKQDIIILQGTSLDRLKDILHLLGPTLYWLDAHLQDSYGLSKDMTDRFPLEKELRYISSHKNIEKDVFLIDDLRIYEEGHFTAGNVHRKDKCPKEGISFIEDILGKSHDCSKSYDDHGYVVCTPKLLR